VSAGVVVADDLGIKPEDGVVRLVRVRLADGVPICLETVHLPAAKVGKLLDFDLTGSLYEILDRDYHLKVVRAEQLMQAIVLDHSNAALLGTAAGSPALRVHRVGLDDRDRRLECTTTIYRGDRYDLRFAVHRD
jgi:GntR family transcriptional regulator